MVINPDDIKVNGRRRCPDCGHVYPPEEFVVTAGNGKGYVSPFCAKCRFHMVDAEMAERMHRLQRQVREMTLRNVSRAASRSNATVQDLWAELLSRFQGCAGIAEYIYQQRNQETPRDQLRYCELLVKLASASTHFDQSEQQIHRMTDKQLEAELDRLLALAQQRQNVITVECAPEGEPYGDRAE